MTRFRPRARLAKLVVVVTLVGLGMLIAPHATAADDHGTPTLSDVHTKDGHVEAVVTLPDARSGAGINPDSLRVHFGDGPGVPAQVTPLAHERRAAMIMIDTSGSMSGKDLTAAKSAATTFLQGIPADVQVGLGNFADHPKILVKPTTHRAPVRNALEKLHAKGSTSLYDAITQAVHTLGDSGSRTIVLLSDGSDTVSKTTLAKVTETVHASGVRLAVVGFHTDDTANSALKSIAHAGDGSLTTALDPGSLRKAFRSAAQEITTQVRIRVPVPAGVSGEQQLSVTGTVAGKPFRAHTPVTVAATSKPSPTATTASAATAPSHHEHAAAPSGGATSMAAPPGDIALWVAVGATFVGLLVLILTIASSAFTREAKRRIRSLDSYVGEVAHHASASGARHASQNVAGTALRAADAYIRSHSSGKRTARTALLLERADLPLRLNEWYVLRVVAAVVAVCLCYLLVGGGVAGTLVAVVLGLLIALLFPPLLLNFLARRRARKFEIQLPDVLTLVATSLATGFSLPQALDEVARDAAEPAAKEFARALAETRIGADLEDALERTATRMDSTNLAWTTMAIRIQRNVGGNLAETLRTTAQTLRDRESLHRQVRALSAEGRLSAYILVALPIFLGLYLLVTNRPYLSLLWSGPLGIAMLSLGGVLLVLGSFWMKKTVEVKV